jgi:small subunit ribosomal protein S21
MDRTLRQSEKTNSRHFTRRRLQPEPSWRPIAGFPGDTYGAIRDGHHSNLVSEVSVAEIRLNEGESLENVLRRFKRKVQAEDIIKEVKRHSYYLKPGERRRVKQAWRGSARGKRFEKKVHLRRTRVGIMLDSGTAT